jgi:soluble cytochrome b562
MVQAQTKTNGKELYRDLITNSNFNGYCKAMLDSVHTPLLTKFDEYLGLLQQEITNMEEAYTTELQNMFKVIQELKTNTAVDNKAKVQAMSEEIEAFIDEYEKASTRGQEEVKNQNAKYEELKSTFRQICQKIDDINAYIS